METILDKPGIDDALQVIDEGLRDISHREIVSTAEIADLLLDVRVILAGVRVELPV